MRLYHQMHVLSRTLSAVDEYLVIYNIQNCGRSFPSATYRSLSSKLFGGLTKLFHNDNYSGRSRSTMNVYKTDRGRPADPASWVG